MLAAGVEGHVILDPLGRMNESTNGLDRQPAPGGGPSTIGFNPLLVVAGMRAVGLLLIAALLVVPVAAGSRIAHSFRGSMLTAMALGVISSMVGLLIALWQGHIAPGGTIVLTALGFFGLSMVFGRRAFRRHPRRVAA